MFDLEEYNRTPIKKVREQVIERLKMGYAHDYLDEVDFENKLTIANSSKSKSELLDLIHDLPAIRQNNSTGETISGVPVNSGHVKPQDTFICFFSGVTRKGRWKPARNTKILSILGGAELDFSEAEFPPGITEIEVLCVLGGAEIVVPEGINVDCSGIPVLGGFENKAGEYYAENSPTLKIRGVALLGGVEVKPQKKRKRRKR